jgi:membrane peptidoglycan carboxypeptidase
MKPLTYLTALQHGLQPNTLILNEPLTLPPIGSGMSGRDIISREFGGSARPEDYWSPRNADYAMGGVLTLRRGLEGSVNLVTAHLLDGAFDINPEKSLDDICATAVAAKIYSQCERYYPFILGAQPVRMIDLAAFYAAVANEGTRPQPHGIDSIEADGKTIYQYPQAPLSWIGAADRTSFYQLKTILQGVVARGTARAIGGLSPYVAGKTGTTEDAVDGWFIGFTNDVTVAVWVGYDNGDGKRRSLGSNETGARVALPIFQPIIEAIWAEHIAPKAPLTGPSPEAKRFLVDIPIDFYSGNRAGTQVDNGSSSIFGGIFNPQSPPQPASGRGGFVEHFRRGPDGQIADTQYQLVSREDAYYQSQWGNEDQSYYGNGYGNGYGGNGQWVGRSYYPSQSWRPAPPSPQSFFRGLFQPWNSQPTVQGRDSDYFWGRRLN